MHNWSVILQLPCHRRITIGPTVLIGCDVVVRLVRIAATIIRAAHRICAKYRFEYVLEIALQLLYVELFRCGTGTIAAFAEHKRFVILRLQRSGMSHHIDGWLHNLHPVLVG